MSQKEVSCQYSSIRFFKRTTRHTVVGSLWAWLRDQKFFLVGNACSKVIPATSIPSEGLSVLQPVTACWGTHISLWKCMWNFCSTASPSCLNVLLLFSCTIFLSGVSNPDCLSYLFFLQLCFSSFIHTKAKIFVFKNICFGSQSLLFGFSSQSQSWYSHTSLVKTKTKLEPNSKFFFQSSLDVTFFPSNFC